MRTCTRRACVRALSAIIWPVQDGRKADGAVKLATVNAVTAGGGDSQYPNSLDSFSRSVKLSTGL